MDKELIDIAWRCLPRDFREEVKKEWKKTDNNTAKWAIEYFFSIHNLTSDAEGEENMQERLWNMLTPKLQTYCYNMGHTSHDGNVDDVLERLFGSKCLPDTREVNFASIEPKPAEPKDEGTRQEQCVPKNAESGTHSFSHILKDSFRKERRLNIAAQIVASMIGSDDWTTWRGGSNKEIWHNMAKSSLEIADALIAEAEKGGGNA